MRARPVIVALAPLFAAGCTSTPERDTLAALRTVAPDVAEVEVANTLDLAMQSYRRYLDETAASPLTPEAMRRLADLKLEKEFGITGDDGGPWREMAAPESAAASIGIRAAAAISTPAIALESDEEFERLERYVRSRRRKESP